MKNYFLVIASLVVIVGVFYFVRTYSDENKLSENSRSGELTCTADSRKVDACAEILEPVCAKVEVQCIKAPCDPVKETFSNSCRACLNPLVKSYTKGECK